MAACLLLAVGMGVWLMLPAPEARASSELVEKLIEWNVDLAQAQTPEERGRIFAEQSAALKTSLQQSDLPADDRALAQTLLDNGNWLAEHDDPLDQADRFNVVADQLVERMNKATAKGNDKEIRRFARHYRQVMEHGVAANLEKVEAAGPVEAKREEKLAAVAQRVDKQAKKLEAMAEQAPAAARKEVRKAHEASAKPGKKQKKNHNTKGK